MYMRMSLIIFCTETGGIYITYKDQSINEWYSSLFCMGYISNVVHLKQTETSPLADEMQV